MRPPPGFKLLARQVWIAYQSGIPAERMGAVGLRPFEDIDQEVRQRMLDAQNGEPPEVRAVLRGKLGEPPETVTPRQLPTPRRKKRLSP